MADEELHRLIVSFEARTDKFGEILLRSGEDFSKALHGMERRQEEFHRNIVAHGERAGREYARRFTAAIAAGLSLAAVEHFVTAQLENAATIEKQSKALGLSTDAFQAWSIIAHKAGTEQDQLNVGVDTFAKNLGEAQLKSTDFGLVLKKLGVDTHGTVEEVFYRFVDALQRTSNAQQRAIALNYAFGRGNVGMAAFVAQGSAAIKEQMAALKANGEIIDRDGITKINELGNAWIDVKAQFTTIGANVLSGFADELHKITGDIKDDGFQTGLTHLGRIMGEVAGYIAQMASHPDVLAVLGGALVGGKILGPGGAVGGAALGYESTHAADLRAWGLTNFFIPHLKSQIQQDQEFLGQPGTSVTAADIEKKRVQLRAYENELFRLQHQNSPTGVDYPTGDLKGFVPGHPFAFEAKPPSKIDLTDSLKPHQKSEAESAAEDIIKHGHEELARIAAEVQGLGLSAGQIAALSYIAESKARITDAKGVYGGTLQKTVEATARDIQLATDKRDLGKLDQDTVVKAGALIAKYREQTAALGLTAGAVERLAFVQERLNAAAAQHITLTAEDTALINREADAVQKSADAGKAAKDAFDRSLQVTDELRNGLEGVAEAGLNGFKSLRSAAGSFIEQMAQLILKLYVLEPLMKAAFGEPGQVGQGAIGSLLFSGGGGLGGLLSGFLGGGAGSGVGNAAGLLNGKATGSSGGFLGSIFDSIGSFFGFAAGGVMTPQGPRNLPRYAAGGISHSAAIFGESGAEAAVPLPDGRRIPVAMNFPNPAQFRGAAARHITVAPVIQIDARYATEGTAAMIEKSLNARAPAIIQSSVASAMGQFNESFPEKLRTTMRDK